VRWGHPGLAVMYPVLEWVRDPRCSALLPCLQTYSMSAAPSLSLGASDGVAAGVSSGISSASASASGYDSWAVGALLPPKEKAGLLAKPPRP